MLNYNLPEIFSQPILWVITFIMMRTIHYKHYSFPNFIGFVIAFLSQIIKPHLSWKNFLISRSLNPTESAIKISTQSPTLR